jgi:flagellar biosynthesis anti-sigma factor FlgM
VKISESGSDILNQALDRVGAPASQAGNRSHARPRPATETGDRVRVSSDAQLLHTAMRAAQQSPEIRQDVVDRMRAALDKGEVGQDPERLADALIDSWITNR